MTRILSLFVMFMLFGVLAFAQGRVVTGTVLDEQNLPVAGASVSVVGSRIGASTDAKGNFRLSNVANNATIRVTGTEIITKDIKSGSEAVVNFIIVKNTSGRELEVVTVVGALGLRRQAKENGAAATTITAKTLTQGKSVNAQQALNGKVSGVSIATTNSSVFENAKINIRGIRSLTGNNQPMLVIDGAPTPLGFLSSIAPEDIQTMTILKSSASAALYGPEAVNGVIIITTKKGTGDKLAVTFTTAAQFTKVAFFPKLQHKFGQGAGELINPDGSYIYIPYENQLYGPAFDGSIQDIGVRLEDGSIQSGPYSNLHASDKRNFYNTGLTIQNTLSISGKDFYFSADDAIIHGTLPEDRNRRTSFRFNASKQYGKLDINYGLNYVLSNFNVLDEGGLAATGGSAYTGGVFNLVLQTADNIPLLQYKDWKNNKFAQYSNFYNEFAINPYYAIGNFRQIGRTDDVIGNIDLGYNIKPWLKANLKINGTISTQSTQNNTAPVIVTDFAAAKRSAAQYSNKPGSVFNDLSNSSRVNFDGYFNGSQGIGKNLNVKYVAGGAIRQNRFKDVAVGGNNLVVPFLYNTSVRSGDANLGGVQSNNFNFTRESAFYSVYGTLGFGFKEFAFVEFTGRNDWDSRLLKNNRSFFYPSVNASLVLSDAIPTLKSNVVSFAKLRGAYSKSANVNLNPYSTQATFSQPLGFPYGNITGFSANPTIPDKNLKPETVITTEGGLELGLFKNRINFEATYFYQDCKDQILTISQPSTTGYPFALANAARFKNYGVELDLGLSPLINVGRGRFDLKMNATYNNNQVLNTFQDLPVTIGGSGNFTTNVGPTVNNLAVVGRPAFAFQLTDYLRDPATGKVIVDKITGLPSQAPELAVKGRSLPLWVVGVTPSFTLGDISISMTFDYKGGHSFYSALGSDMDFDGTSARSAQYNRQNFVFPNSVYDDGTGKFVNNTNILTQDGNYAFWTGASTNRGIATNYFQSAAAIRLRELNLSYNLPQTILRNSKIFKRLTFAIVGKNLFLFTPKSNEIGDPEFNYSATNNTFGIGNSNQSPSSRLLGLSLTAQF